MTEALDCRDELVELISLIISGLALLGSAVGFIAAQLARKKADESERKAQAALDKSADAQADAAAALARSADSGDRIAAAVELLAERAAEPDVDFVAMFNDALDAKVEWAIEERSEAHRYRLRNTGDLRADDVHISADPPERAALLIAGHVGTLRPAEATNFATSPRLSLSLHRISVRWVDGDTRQPRSRTIDLP